MTEGVGKALTPLGREPAEVSGGGAGFESTSAMSTSMSVELAASEGVGNQSSFGTVGRDPRSNSILYVM